MELRYRGYSKYDNRSQLQPRMGKERLAKRPSSEKDTEWFSKAIGETRNQAISQCSKYCEQDNWCMNWDSGRDIDAGGKK